MSLSGGLSAGLVCQLSASLGGGGAAPSSAPSPPAGAVFATVAHPTLCTTDTAGGTPCGDGDAIRWWRDLVSGTWYEQATSGSRWIMRADGAKWYAENDGTRSHRFGNITGYGSATNFLAVGCRTTGTGQYSWIRHGAETNDPRSVRSLWVGLTTAGVLSLQTQSGNGAFFGTVDTSNRRLVIQCVSPLQTSLAFVDGSASAWVSGQTGVLANTTGPLVIGAWIPSGNSPVGRLYATAVCDSSTTAAALNSWLAEYMP